MAANPLAGGIGKEELKTRLPRRSDQRFFALLLSDLEKEGRLVPDRDIVRLAPSLRQSLPGDRNISERISALLAQNGLEPPTVKELMELLAARKRISATIWRFLPERGVLLRCLLISITTARC